MSKDALSPWQALKRGIDRFFIGMMVASGAALVLWLVSSAAAGLIDLSIAKPVRLTDDATTAILFCKAMVCYVAFTVGLGVSD